PGTLPGEPGLIELLRTLVELRHLVEAAGLHVHLHQELPPLPLLEERLRLTGRKLRGQPARGVAVLRRQRRPERRTQVVPGLEQPGRVGERAVPIVQPRRIARPPT